MAAGMASDEAAADLAELMERRGAKDFCEQMARDYLTRGFAWLARVEPEAEAAEALRVLAHFLVERSS